MDSLCRKDRDCDNRLICDYKSRSAQHKTCGYHDDRRRQEQSLENTAKDWVEAVKEEVKTMDQAQKDEAIRKTEEYIQHLEQSEKTENDGETKKDLSVAIKYTKEGLSVLQGRRRSEQVSLEEKAKDWVQAVK